MKTATHFTPSSSNFIDNDMSPFQQSDWEQSLDLMQDPTVCQLRAHLARVPAAEARGETALFLVKHIASLSEHEELQVVPPTRAQSSKLKGTLPTIGVPMHVGASMNLKFS